MRKNLAKDDVLLVLDYLQDWLECQNQEQLNQLLSSLKELIPHDFLVSAKFSLENFQITKQEVFNLSYPKEWLDLYATNDFHLIDPIVKAHLDSFSLQNWEDTYKKYPCPYQFKVLASDFNLLDGFTFGGLNKKGSCARGSCASLFSLSGRVDNSLRSLAILNYLSPFLHQKLISIDQKNTAKGHIKLSERELEVIKWLQKGKTTWDISMILQISERTVKFHVKNIMNKLNAVSRMHAVAIVVSNGLVDVD